MSLYLFVVLGLSTWRFTRLVVEDTLPLVARPRAWVVARKPGGNLAYLLGCTWCASVWVAAAHVGALYAVDYGSVPGPVFLAAALSLVAGFGEAVVDWLDRYGLEGAEK